MPSRFLPLSQAQARLWSTPPSLNFAHLIYYIDVSSFDNRDTKDGGALGGPFGGISNRSFL